MQEYDNDLILLAEFCELDGPRAILTIPKTGRQISFEGNNSSLFSIDDFILQIMTTDYQNFQCDKWDEKSDVICIRTHILPGVHGILHYFTLQDPDARGWVRPACVCYVCQDAAKLHHLQRNVTKVLKYVAAILKHDNLRWMEKKYSVYNEHKKDTAIMEILTDWEGDSSLHYLSDSGKYKKWPALCTSGFKVACWCLLQLYRRSRPALMELVLNGSDDSEFVSDKSAAAEDTEYQDLLSGL